MPSCRICYKQLLEPEKVRGTCDSCEKELAKQILRKIVLNHEIKTKKACQKKVLASITT